MQYFIFEDATGRIRSNRKTSMATPALMAANVPVGCSYIEGSAEPEAEYVFNGVKVARPTVPAFTNPYDLTALPAGTTVTITDEAGSVTAVTVLDEDLTLVGPETYEVKIEPPFPYISIETEFEVT